MPKGWKHRADVYGGERSWIIVRRCFSLRYCYGQSPRAKQRNGQTSTKMKKIFHIHTDTDWGKGQTLWLYMWCHDRREISEQRPGRFFGWIPCSVGGRNLVSLFAALFLFIAGPVLLWFFCRVHSFTFSVHFRSSSKTNFIRHMQLKTNKKKYTNMKIWQWHYIHIQGHNSGRKCWSLVRKRTNRKTST